MWLNYKSIYLCADGWIRAFIEGAQYLLRVRVYPAESDELPGKHVVEKLRLVRRLHRVRRTLTKTKEHTKMNTPEF